MVGLGFVAGMAFVVACPSPQDVMSGLGTSGGSDGGLFGSSTASAADIESDCTQWEVQAISVPARSGGTGFEIDTVTALPAGWAPFATDAVGYASVLVRRCAD